MTDAITFRTTDLTRWGTGKNSRLSKTEIDINFWVCQTRILALEDHSAAAAVGVADFFVDPHNPTQFYEILTDATQLGPFSLPTTTWTFTNPPTGAWVPTSGYSKFDVFNFGGSLYVVNVAHTSASSFDPGATDGSAHNLYTLLIQVYGIPVKTVSTSTFTPDLSYCNTYIRCTNSTGCIFTVPNDSSVNWASVSPNVELHVRDCTTSGNVIFVAGSGVTINLTQGRIQQTAANGAVVGIKRIGANAWDMWGLLGTSG